MTVTIDSIRQMVDRELLTHVHRAAAAERQATAQLIALLMELDARRLYLKQGCSSLFTYCTQVLHLSEHAAYGRIEAARAARRFPAILERLAAGRLTLTAIGLLAPHLTHTNHVEVLDAACHKSKREVEQLVARLNPKPDVPAVIRKLPEPKSMALRPAAPVLEISEDRAAPSPTGSIATVQTHRAEVRALAPERYKIQFTVSRETYDRLRRVQDLMRHTIPNGDPAVIFDRALTLLLGELSKSKFAAAGRPRPAAPPAPRQRGCSAERASRHVPAAVKREVWHRDGGRCAFTGAHGRCTETGFLEFHHVIPFADGGATTSDNLELRCRAHNVYDAERWFGPRHSPLLREEHTRYLTNEPTRSRTELEITSDELAARADYLGAAVTCAGQLTITSIRGLHRFTV